MKENSSGRGLHDILRSPSSTLEIVARLLIASIIVGATIVMIILRLPIPDAWWAMATAVTAYLFQPQIQQIEARRHRSTSPDLQER